MSASPGWKRLWRHSYRVGFGWLLRTAPRGLPAKRTGFARLLVPLDPWRYYELGKMADEPIAGDCLDVSSPKLLPSLLQREGKGDWLCIDLFDSEIEAWRHVDPKLRLEVQDATALPYDEASFDNVVCASVLEHIGRGKDSTALSEFFRVLKPGGTLLLTTDVATEGRDVFLGDEIYGQASERVDADRVFFKHDYSVAEIDEMIGEHPWDQLEREYVKQRDPEIERKFYARAPWSYIYGPALRWRCPENFETSASPEILDSASQGVIYLKLQKPGDGN
ncbi:MAG: class I SAM-dependent methyltransferase [Solirubrobacterales bacterium]